MLISLPALCLLYHSFQASTKLGKSGIAGKDTALDAQEKLDDTALDAQPEEIPDDAGVLLLLRFVNRE